MNLYTLYIDVDSTLSDALARDAGNGSGVWRGDKSGWRLAEIDDAPMREGDATRIAQCYSLNYANDLFALVASDARLSDASLSVAKAYALEQEAINATRYYASGALLSREERDAIVYGSHASQEAGITARLLAREEAHYNAREETALLCVTEQLGAYISGTITWCDALGVVAGDLYAFARDTASDYAYELAECFNIELTPEQHSRVLCDAMVAHSDEINQMVASMVASQPAPATRKATPATKATRKPAK